jgi:primary-amine oxidase
VKSPALARFPYRSSQATRRRRIDGEDLVLWYTLGFRHVTRAEDWPSMPAVWHSFQLRPFNSFDQSPAMDVR